MPYRVVPLVTNEIYHVFNRGVNGNCIFLDDRYFKRMMMTIHYYQFEDLPLRLSRYLCVAREKRALIKRELSSRPKSVEVLAYCLMDNHYHLMIKQLKDGAIERFLRMVQDSFASYFNRKNRRFGPLFTGRFKAVLVENEQQLLHLSRYIHLNPYTSGKVKHKRMLGEYPWSSFGSYLTGIDEYGVCKSDVLSNLVGGRNKYENYVLEFADFEKEYKLMKKLMLDAGI